METIAFDTAYRGLSAAMVVILGFTIVRAVRQTRASDIGANELLALGVTLAAAGILASLVVGVGLNELRHATGDVFYQVVHFVVLYLGMGLVLAGAERVAGSATAPASELGPRLGLGARSLAWSAFSISVVVSTATLIEGAAVASGAGGRMPQQEAYFLPVFVVLALAVGRVAAATIRGGATGPIRARLAWFGAFALLAFVGMLREATIIPSVEPLVDLGLAFGSFTAATACLWMAGRSVRPMAGSGATG